ncbi:hypothetical protein SPBRAN_257 [uncultured Candidatus Thioglobus sp.]|nr:hypothetical protein SPBRAN_257 [uncultured Candidatus Thioglobus sp.]
MANHNQQAMSLFKTFDYVYTLNTLKRLKPLSYKWLRQGR